MSEEASVLESQTEVKRSFAWRLGQHFAGWRRFVRIGMCWFITLLVSAAIVLPVLYYLSEQSDPLAGDNPSAVPTAVMIIAALVMYIISWSALVGFDPNDRQNWQPSALTGWVVLGGLAAFFALIIEIVWWSSFVLNG
jgi:hypothetical protein